LAVLVAVVGSDECGRFVLAESVLTDKLLRTQHRICIRHGVLLEQAG
jgi:hypothetical protein